MVKVMRKIRNLAHGEELEEIGLLCPEKLS